MVDSESRQMFKPNLDIFLEIIRLEHEFTGRNHRVCFTPRIKLDYHKVFSDLRMF